jgi:hypothetical protein
MKKSILTSLILLFVITTYCQTKENSSKLNFDFPAEKDKEFDKGSGITIVSLDKNQIENLKTFGFIWGFLKYYHPNIAKGEYNWDYELFRILPKILNSDYKKNRDDILIKWIENFGHFSHGKETVVKSSEIKNEPDLDWIKNSNFSDELTTLLLKVKNANRPKEHYYIGLHLGVGNPEFKNERSYDSMIYPDQGFRLLSLYRYWNIIAYYFPYKNLIEEDWNMVLGEYIPKFINAGNELEYKLNVLSLIARIHDTHANIWGTDYTLYQFWGKQFSPLEITFIENKAIVTGYFDKIQGEKTGLKIGDAIEAIEGKTVDEIIKEKLPLTPASNYPTQLRDIAKNLLRTNKSSLEVLYWNGNQKVSTQIETFYPNEINLYAKYQKPDTGFKMLNSDIAYICSIKNEHVPKIMNDVLKTRGLIIDFRGYPLDFIVFSLGEYLLPEPKSFAKVSSGSIESPGLFTLTQDIKVGKSNPDYYKGKIVIIVNETTQSLGEFITMAFRTAPKAKVIGSTTAGADGNISRFILPGGISTMISGIGVYYPDGTETQRIGIVPDIELKPTIQGIKKGQDELINKAIEIINGQ